MKKILIALVVMICLVTTPIIAKNQNIATTSQLMIEIDYSFWSKDIIAGYAYGTYFYDIGNSYSALYGYLGSRFGEEKYGVYILFACLGDNVGILVGPSLWLEYNLKNKYYFFLEGDYYIPIAAASQGDDVVLPKHFYYSQGEASRQFKEDVKLGLMYELQGLFIDFSPIELAFGPFGQFKKLRFWLFWDTTPLLNGDDIIGIRFKYKI